MVLVKRYLYLFSVLILFILSPCRCRSNMSGKIVGGDYATIRHYPHAVFLEAEIMVGKERHWACGASVLNQRMIVTAAHCFEKLYLGSRGHAAFVYAGSEDYNNKNCVQRDLRQIIMHEYYDEVMIINDIALAELERAFPLNDNIKRVILLNRFPTDINGIVAGWGLVDDRPPIRVESKLKYVTQQVQSISVCSKLRGLRSPAMFCATNIKTYNHRPSGGDSGSGFVTPKGELLGLVSYRDPYFRHLVIYTNVTYHLNWVKTTSKKMVCRN